MQLLIETLDNELLVESKAGKTYIQGIFMQAEQPNRNGRIYRANLMEREVNRFQQAIAQNRSMGELNHPGGPTINLDRVSHRIVEMKRDGNNVMGKALLTKTPMGDIAKGLLESGCRLGVSSRGMGSLKLVGNVNEVQDDFRLVTVDIVGDPSAPDAWVDAINETKEWLLNENTGKWESVTTDQIVKKLKTLHERHTLVSLGKFLQTF